MPTYSACGQHLFLSACKRTSQRATEDKTWLTGKHTLATVATADTAKNNPAGTERKFTPKKSHRYRQQGNYKFWNEDQIHDDECTGPRSVWSQSSIFCSPQWKEECHMTDKTHKQKAEQKEGELRGRADRSSSSLTLLTDLSLNKVW